MLRLFYMLLPLHLILPQRVGGFGLPWAGLDTWVERVLSHGQWLLLRSSPYSHLPIPENIEFLDVLHQRRHYLMTLNLVARLWVLSALQALFGIVCRWLPGWEGREIWLSLLHGKLVLQSFLLRLRLHGIGRVESAYTPADWPPHDLLSVTAALVEADDHQFVRSVYKKSGFVTVKYVP